jgi:glucan phosphorylase
MKSELSQKKTKQQLKAAIYAVSASLQVILMVILKLLRVCLVKMRWVMLWSQLLQLPDQKALRRPLRNAGFTQESFSEFGREHPGSGPICMTVLALRMAERINGVSKLHGRVSREMWVEIFGRRPDDVPIGSVTNGVHIPTWIAPEARSFWRRSVGIDLGRSAPDANPWAAVPSVGHADFWQMRCSLRRKLVQFVRARLRQREQRWRQRRRHQTGPRHRSRQRPRSH